EEMDGAGLAAEPAAELLEYAVGPVEDVAVVLDRVAIPGRVLAVLGEGRRHRNPEWVLVDLDVDSELAQRFVETGVEGGDRDAVGEAERPSAAVVRANEQRVVDEGEIDVEGRAFVLQPRGREAAHVDIERDV